MLAHPVSRVAVVSRIAILRTEVRPALTAAIEANDANTANSKSVGTPINSRPMSTMRMLECADPEIHRLIATRTRVQRAMREEGIQFLKRVTRTLRDNN